ncbi:concanavalin A-like lectin/glucanase domain-containing protein [Gigaspora rosea]|uniref:Concanavalin A-like lectin/glucanase domain-containing protein n=1 Tax=Gigaspora rosea TaxID=44941 RepID=A0A397VDJ8_9GLOM|nr:concanavalin A-like lectin/glucanase domain-containing protein [Gigaspora rosea]
MGETTLFNGLVLPTAWNIDDTSQFVSIDSSGLKVNYTDPNDYKTVVIRANNPIPSQCGLFYFEIEIINEGKNGIIGIGYCTKQNKHKRLHAWKYVEDEENKENKSWGCAYHGDDGYFFCSGSGKPYGPKYTAGDTIGCYLNFRNDDKMIFYTKNGINLGIVCYLPNNLDGLKNNLYPCIELRSQDSSVEANFGRKKFKYLTMTNDDIGKELWEACWINSKTFDQYVDELKNKSNDTLSLTSLGKAYLIIGKYEEAYAVSTRLLEIESKKNCSFN